MELSSRDHIVLIHRYFNPDTPPYASILHGIALALGDAGFRVTVLTCAPSYNRAVVDDAPKREQIAPNVFVRRFGVLDDRRSTLLKLVNLVLFALKLALATPRLGKVDTFMAASTPPVAIARLGLILARLKRAKFIYHHQDIYPEILLSEGRYSRLSALLRRIDASTDQRADRIVVLSGDMARTLNRRGVEDAKIRKINNFDPWTLPVSGDARRAIDGPLIVVYAGNLGRFQGLEKVFATLVELKDENVEFHFIGDGPLRPGLEQLVKDHSLAKVNCDGYMPPSDLADFLRERAHVGLVSLQPGVVFSAFPSKTMSYLRNGLPVLSAVEPESDLASMLVSHGAGWVADPAVDGSMAREIRNVADSRLTLDERGAQAHALYLEQFSRDIVLQRWVELYRGLKEEGTP